MTAVDITALTYQYPGSSNPALRSVSLTIEKGEFVGLAGANNSGKSTLCHAMAGIVPRLYHGKMTGQVRINGIDSALMSISSLAGQVGLVMQNPESQLSGIRYSVFEEVAFALENQGLDREDIRLKTAAALSITGLSGLADRSPYHLSGGEQQRLALASVLAAGPPVIVLDEPTAFLDPQGTRQLFDILVRLNQQGKTIIIAEQRLERIAACAGRVVVLKNGAKLLDGPAETVLASVEIRQAGLEWTRYTQVARLAREHGLWNTAFPLPASFAKTIKGLRQP